MGNYYQIELTFVDCSEETFGNVETLLEGGDYGRNYETNKNKLTVSKYLMMKEKTWKEDERFMRHLLRILLPGETVLIQATDEYGVYGEDDAGLPVPWVGTLADYVVRFFETDE